MTQDKEVTIDAATYVMDLEAQVGYAIQREYAVLVPRDPHPAGLKALSDSNPGHQGQWGTLIGTLGHAALMTPLPQKPHNVLRLYTYGYTVGNVQMVREILEELADVYRGERPELVEALPYACATDPDNWLYRTVDDYCTRIEDELNDVLAGYKVLASIEGLDTAGVMVYTAQVLDGLGRVIGRQPKLNDQNLTPFMVRALQEAATRIAPNAGHVTLASPGKWWGCEDWRK